MPANLVVRGNQLLFGGKIYRCAIGKGGFSAHKKEGDGATPVGIFKLRECWYRADRIDAPEIKLPLRMIHENDGWCDDTKNKDYNKHIKLPFAASHERLWRDDHVYDLIVPMGYNDSPPVSGKGSAIFLHLAHPDYKPTEGCIALAKPDFLAILPAIDTETTIEIKE
jgi:L,D-peptidoglycan transpeptidase YkuD (ErfK/YbiS/YcfS/YnhG family)